MILQDFAESIDVQAVLACLDALGYRALNGPKIAACLADWLNVNQLDRLAEDHVCTALCFGASRLMPACAPSQ